ncbi:hypothetical protein AKJ56_02070, partial [candidate division MSBL1 archaeon SCGC-AAA382N08]
MKGENKMENSEKVKREKEIVRFELKLETELPSFYRQFLLEQGSAVIAGYPIFGLVKKKAEEEKGTTLFFRKGDLNRGSFDWVAEYEGRIVGLCNRPNCGLCDMEQRKKLMSFQGGELRVELQSYQKGSKKFYIAHLVSFPEKELILNEPKISVLEATQLLRDKRPDLPHDFLAISFSGERALCFDLARSSGDDAPLVDVPLDKEEEILPVADSFKEFVERHNSFEKDFRRELGRLRRRKSEVEKKMEMEEKMKRGIDRKVKIRRLDKKNGVKSTLHSRPKDWHPRIVRFHDNTVALTAYRYNDRHHKLEVDAFFAHDHPLYIPGDPMRGLMIILFSEALVLGGSLDLVFTRGTKGGRFEIPLPKSLIRFAEERGVEFSRKKDGEIIHEEGLELWWTLLELTPKAEERGVRLDKYGYLPKENLALILSSGIWTREETIWLLENSPRPEGILAGADTPKKRFYNMESVTYGVAALLVSRLQRKIMVELAEGFGPEERMVAECVIEPIGKFHILKCDEEFELPWVYSKRNVKVKPEESILILSRPKVVARPSIDFDWLVNQIELVSSTEIDASFRCLLLGMEYRDFPRMDELLQVAKEKDVLILLAPRRLDHYQQEVLQKMRKAGNLKRLPPREGPINLWVFSVKADCWDSPVLKRSTRDADTFARWINKGVDVKRAEYEFFLNCSVVEREVLQNEECASPMVKFYYESGDDFNIAEALKLWGKLYKGIMFPFLRPKKEVESFLKEIPMRFLSNLRPPKGKGLVFIPEPYGAIVEDVGFEKKRKWVSLKTVIDSEVELPEPSDFKRRRASDFAYQINECLKEGKPLPVSYLTPHLFFPEVIREYLYYREKGYSSKSSKVVVKRDS